MSDSLMHAGYTYDDSPRCASQFTGKERDTETGLDYFGARYYASNMGRFMSVDNVIITPARLSDPQRLNLYGYARNNPLSYIDVDGEDIDLARISHDVWGVAIEERFSG